MTFTAAKSSWRASGHRAPDVQCARSSPVPSPPLTVPLGLGDGAVVHVAVRSYPRAADLLLLEVDAGEGSVVVPQV